VWERTVEQPGCVPSSTSESVLRSMPRSELENILGVVFGSILGVYLGVSWELSWKCIVNHAGSVLLSAIGSVLECMPRSVLVNVLGVCFQVS
jgi:hypothetical protein